MAETKSIREHVLYLLKEGGAHVGFSDALKNVPLAVRGKRPRNAEHSLWELLEHMRIAQRDILEFSRNPEHQSPKWPEGYWPSKPVPPSTTAWNKAIRAFQADLEEVCALVADESRDLLEPFPHGTGQTLLREALLVADHNAYHLGQFVLVRRLLGVWK